MVKVSPKDIEAYVPVFMISKYRKISDPGAGMKHRCIFNGSYTKGDIKGINYSIPDIHRKVQYPPIIATIIGLIERIYKKKQRVYIGTMDVQNGFENLFIPQPSQRLTGISIEDIHLKSYCALYGTASRPFQMHNMLYILVELIQIYLKIEKDIILPLANDTMKYMDDIGIFAASKEEVNIMIDHIQTVSWDIFGIPFKTTKTQKGTDKIDRFLGFAIDLTAKDLNDYTISPCKATIDKLCYRADILVQHNTFTLRTLTSWLGSAYNISHLKYPLKSMIRTVGIIHKEYLHLGYAYNDPVTHNSQLALLITTVTDQLLKMPPIILKKYKMIHMNKIWTTGKYHNILYTDASDWGYGIIDITNGRYCMKKWPKSFTDRIDVREALSPLAYFTKYGSEYSNKHVMLWIDNQPVMNGIIKKRYKYIKVDVIIHELFKICMKYDIILRVDYINTHANKLADSLSRGDIKGFHTEINKNKQIKLNKNPSPLPLIIPDYNIFNLLKQSCI